MFIGDILECVVLFQQLLFLWWNSLPWLHTVQHRCDYRRYYAYYQGMDRSMGHELFPNIHRFGQATLVEHGILSLGDKLGLEEHTLSRFAILVDSCFGADQHKLS